MDYEEYQKDSNARLREKTPNRESLTGYSETEKESKEKTVPLEAMRLENGQGGISLGVNRKKEIYVAVYEDSEGMLRQDRKSLHMSGAKIQKRMGGRFYTNSHQQEKSALVYKVEAGKQPGFVLDKIKKKLLDKRNEPAAEVAPFLAPDSRTEEEKKKWEPAEKFLEQNMNKTQTKIPRLIKRLSYEYDFWEFLKQNLEKIENEKIEKEED